MPSLQNIERAMEEGSLRDWCSDTNAEMQRRTPVRKASRSTLDDEQRKRGMEVLGKFVMNKYQNVLLLTQDQEHGEPSSPHTQSAFQFPRQFTTTNRMSTACVSTPVGLANSESFPTVNPMMMVNKDVSVKQEMKLKTMESWSSYVLRIVRFFYNYLGLKYLFLVSLIIGYALLGGFIFLKLEEEHQKLEIQKNENEFAWKSEQVSKKIREIWVTHNCDSLNPEIKAYCSELIKEIFMKGSMEVKHLINQGWKWDYWNAVFYSGTIFTTIGYGNLTCTTPAGRLMTIIYGLIGIPLMLFVMKIIGEASFGRAQSLWFVARRRMLIWYRNRKRKTVESVYSFEIDEPETETSQYTSFPVLLALGIIFGFMVVCSIIVSQIEKWDFLTAFYFFFVSLSTIGFGDVIPEHPRTACGLFAMYFVGLALFSMVYAIIQQRVEIKYMWALELIDQEYQENLKQENQETKTDEERKVDECQNSMFSSSGSVNWRGSENMHVTDRPNSERRFSVALPGDNVRVSRPVLEAFMSLSSSGNNNLTRSESTLSRGFANAKRPTVLFPRTETMTNLEQRRIPSPWLSADVHQPSGPVSLGVKPTNDSIPSPGITIRSPSNCVLSVITEVSDEDMRHFKKNSRRLLRSEATDRGSIAISMESLETPLEEKSKSERFTSQLPSHYPRIRRHSNQDIITPANENEPLSPMPPLSRNVSREQIIEEEEDVEISD